MEKPGHLPKIFMAISASVAGLLIAWIVAVRYLPPQILYRSDIHRTEEAIQVIEQYKVRNGMYPKESQYRLTKENMFYMLKDDGYVAGFSMGFDESYFYDSRTRKWSFEK